MKKTIILSSIAALMSMGAATASAETYPRKLLLEQETTLNCGNCPSGDKTLEAANPDPENTVWIRHHVGFGTDEFTHADSERFMQRYGTIGAPRASFNRKEVLNYMSQLERFPVINYTPFDAGVNLVRSFFEAGSKTADVKIELTPEYNKATRHLTLKVKLTKNENLPARAMLSLHFAEDEVEAIRSQAGDPSKKFHDGVYRGAITDFFGESIHWDGNTFEKTYEADINEAWRYNQLQVVAIVNPPVDSDDAEVYNCETTGHLRAEGDLNEETFPRKVLIEQYTTLKCVNCPNGIMSLTKATTDRDDTVWIAHHVGYGTDEFTVADSQEMIPAFGVTGAPYAQFDRTAFNGAIPQGIGYGNTTQGGSILAGYIDQCAAVPANVKIDLDVTYDAEQAEGEVTVTLTKNDLLNPEALLTVQLLENNVEAEYAQAGAATMKIHNHVYRGSLTDILGDAIEWDGYTYSKTFPFAVNADWNPSRIKVLAFVNNPVSGADKSVQNVEMTDYFTESTGIDGIAADTATAPTEYFNLQGVKISEPRAGELVICRRGDKAVKMIF